MLQLRLQKLLAQYRCLCRAALGDNLGFSSQDEVTQAMDGSPYCVHSPPRASRRPVLVDVSDAFPCEHARAAIAQSAVLPGIGVPRKRVRSAPQLVKNSQSSPI